MNEDNTLIYDWMPLIRLSNGSYPVYMPQIRAANTQSSFPIPVKAFMLLPFDVMPVYNSTEPSYNSELEYVEEGDPSQAEDGKYYKTWIVKQYTQEQLDNNLAQAKQMAISAASSVIGNDIWAGMPWDFNGTTYIVEVSSEKLSLLISIKSLAKDATDEDNFPFSFSGGLVIALTKQEFLDMWQSVTTKLYDSYKNYWAFLETINQSQSISSIPEIPQSFIQNN